MDLNPDDWRLGVTRGSGRSQVQYLLDEAPHGLVLDLCVGDQEPMVQQLGVTRSLVWIFVDALRDELIELSGEFLWW